jgi:hypothetical protein
VGAQTSDQVPGTRHLAQTSDQEPGTRFLKLSEAEKLTGMKQQRVSDLGKRLGQPDKYRKALLGAEYRAAMLEALGQPYESAP